MEIGKDPSAGHIGCTTVELRIHGVGPQTPADVLGVGTEDDLEDIIANPDRTASSGKIPKLDKGRVWQRRSDTETQRSWPRDTQAFMWDGLTSSSRFQAFWPILLPFTLLNVAGWMHPRGDGAATRANWTRRLILALGLTMSATWGLWIAIFVGYGGHVTPPDVPGVLLAAAPIVLGVTVVIVLLLRRFGESVVGDESVVGVAPAGSRISFRDRARPIVNIVVGTVVVGVADIGLAWAAGDDLGVLWWRIALVTAGLMVAGSVVAIALRTRLDFEDYAPTRTAELRSALPIGVDRVHVESLADDQFFSKEANRKANPAVHIAALLGAVVVGIVGVRWGTVDWHIAELGQVQGNVASLAFLVMGAIQFLLLGLLYALSVKADVEPPNLRFRWAGPATTAGLAILLGNGVFAGFALFIQQHVGIVPAGPEVALIEAPMAGVILLALLAGGVVLAVLTNKPEGEAGTAIALAHVPRNLDVVLSVSVATTLLAGAGVVVVRFHNGSLDTVGDSPLSKAAQYLFPLAALAALGFVRKALTAQSARRQVGLVWDVLSFWPRRFHPFAVRPYSEKIVPQFQDHLARTLHDFDGVVISAHSQGSVIAYAALRGLETTSLSMDRVALVTYGSPLLRLFARLFPHYVRRDDFATMATRGPAHSRLVAWNNYFHATDPIGQDVFTDPDARGTAAVGRDPRDHLLDDPVTTVPVPSPTEPSGDQTRAPHDGLGIHSQYRREQQVKERILANRSELCFTRPAEPPTPEEPVMTPIEIPEALRERLEELLQAQARNVHGLPRPPTAHPTKGSAQIAPAEATVSDVVEAAVNLLEVHWVRDENDMDQVKGYPFQKLYSHTPADPLLRQRTAKEFDLSEPFVFTGKRDKGDEEPPTWVVAEKPESTDFASIPGLLTWLIPRYGRHTMAALIHDHLQELLTEAPETEPTRNGEQTVTSTQADYIMREAMRSSGVPFAQRWVMWAGISVRTLVTKPLNLWYALAAVLFVIGYGFGVGFVGLGWLLTLPIVHLSGGSPWTPSLLQIAVVLISPLALAVLWLPRWRTGVIAAYTVMLVAMPVVFITVARCIYWFVELLGKLRPRYKVPVDGADVTFEHNPIFETNWPQQRATRDEKLNLTSSAAPPPEG